MTVHPLWERAGEWTPARVDMLCRHYALGLTAAQSAEVLGGVSHNAVISKRLRLGLTARAAAPVSPLAGLLAGRRIYPAEPPPLPCEPLPDMDFAPPAGSRPSRLIDKERRECAWPLGPAGRPGDYRTLYCCAPTERRKSYCAVHARRARRAP